MNRKPNRIAILFAAATLLAAAAPSSAGDDDTTTAPESMAKQYLAIQVALAGDTLADVPEHASALSDLAAGAAKSTDSRKDNETAREYSTISQAAGKLAQAGTLADARAAFGDLSETLAESNDLVAGEGVRLAYCPMAKKHWLQASGKIANPYYGASMLRCGQFQDQAPAKKAGH